MAASVPGLQEADLYRCVHCGLCLNECPTYLETGLETESPRGRIALMRARHEGRVGLTADVITHWKRCLQCRACEAACPSGVPYGRMMEATRAQLATERSTGPVGRLLRWAALEQVLPHQGRLETLARLLRLYQHTGMQRLVRASRMLRLAPALARAEALLPEVPSRRFRARGQHTGQEGARGTVALFSGCVAPILYGRVHEATVRVLERAGFAVVAPAGQTCCGALNVHAGERRTAKEMARRNIAALLASGARAIAVNAAGCGAHLKEYSPLLADDPEYGERARRFGGMVKDVSELLAEAPLPALGEVRERAVYQESCHLAHAQRIRDAPRRLLAAIPGLQVVQMAESDVCCGAAGSFSLTQPEMSRRLLERKLRHIREAAPTVIVTANPGCMLQLEQGLREAGLAIPVVHTIELLDRALGEGGARG